MFNTYSTSSFEAVQIHNDENSFMTKALLEALDHSVKKNLCNDLYKYIVDCEYILHAHYVDTCLCIICPLDYALHNISASSGQPFIRPEISYNLSPDLSLDDPIFPPSSNKARDLLLGKKSFHA